MTIAIFTECYRPIVNGVVVSVSTFTQELRKLGLRVMLFAPAFPGYREQEPDVRRVPSLALPTRPRYPLPVPWPGRWRWELAAAKPDLIHTQSPLIMGRAGMGAARRLGLPLVLTYHTLLRAYAHYVPLPRAFVRRWAVKLTRDYANRCDCVVVPSAGIKQVLVTYGVTARIEVIPTGVDLAWAGGGEPAPIRQRWGIPREAPLIVYAGRVALEKNIDLLVEGFARLARGSFPGAHLLLVGGGPWDRATLERARRLGVADRVHLAGYLPREEVFRCYAEADLLAFPSLTDTQGLVVLEAMAMGTPPVAVRSSAVEGLISPGEDGVLVEAKPEALARAMGELLADPGRRRELGARAREKARAFSAESCARRLAEVYRELVEQRQGKAGRGGKERAGSR